MKKFAKSISLVLVSVFSLSMLLTGCSSDKGTKPSDSKPATTVKVEEKKLNFPEKQITFVIPAAAGGATDVMARAIEKVWSKYCPQPLLILNKGAAAGVEGANTVAKAKPDGYTLLIAYGAGQDIIAPFLQELPYDSIKDFAPVSMLSITSGMIAVPVNSPFKTLKDVVDFGKKNTNDSYGKMIKELGIKQ